MPTNLTDRLGELVDKVTPGPCVAAAKPSSVVGWPVVAQSGRLVCSMNYVHHSAIDPKIPGDDAFNRESKANAEFIALCFTHKDEILSALRKVDENERLTAEAAGLREAVQLLRNGYADAVDGYHYIIQRYGRLAGVGFDRVIDHYDEWVTIPEREGLLAGSHVISARLSLGDEK